MPNNDRYIIEILDVALNVLDELAYSQEEFYSLSEQARKLNINRSRLFRILKTLERRGFVDYDQKTESYQLGLKFLSLGQKVRENISLRREAEEILKNLAVDTGDTVYLIIASGNAAIIIDRYVGKKMLQMSAPIGAMLPFHVGAGPKLLLAFMPEDQRKHIIDTMQFTAFTPNTITEKKIFYKTLDEICRNGYAVDEQDYELGAYAFGAPVYDHEGKLVAGISVTTPTVRYNKQRRQELIYRVQLSAKKLSEKLGNQST